MAFIYYLKIDLIMFESLIYHNLSMGHLMEVKLFPKITVSNWNVISIVPFQRRNC